MQEVAPALSCPLRPERASCANRMDLTRRIRIAVMAGAVLMLLGPLATQAQEQHETEPAALPPQVAVDVAYCMSLAYKLGLAVSARALGGSPEELEQALQGYAEDARSSFAEATDDMAEFDFARQESELAEARQQFLSLLAKARDWDGQPETGRILVEAARQLGQQLETICKEVGLLNEEALAAASSVPTPAAWPIVPAENRAGVPTR
ncbi:MAG TPA: hypothetical protein VMH26_14215 [Burkholderiales bacterium]|nr:hypothetical protein [Burkholderiales bacterium]